MKKNWGPKIIIVAVVLIMLIPIIIDAVSSSFLAVLKYDKLRETINNTTNFDYALIYVAPKSDEVKEKRAKLKEITNNYKASDGTSQMKAYYLDSTDLTSEQKSEFFEEGSKNDEAYAFVVNGEIIKTKEGEMREEELKKNIEYYTSNSEEYDSEFDHYKVPKDAKEFNSIVKDKKKVNMFVFGRDTCFYCNQFKIVYNTIIEETGIDSIYYIDSDTYDSDEYDKIMDSGLKIPAKCNEGKEVELQSGFSTPLTLITKNGKVIDCISGYSNKRNLTTQLETVGILTSE